MSPDQLELYRHAILLQLEAASPVPLTPSIVAQGLKINGFRQLGASLDKELSYLLDKQFADCVVSEISSVQRFRLAAKGRDYLEAQGLV